MCGAPRAMVMIDDHFSEFAKILEHYSLPFFHEYEIIFGVHYLHARQSDKGDIYLTRFGIRLIDDLIPPVFLTDKEWFREPSQRLDGTSSTYKARERRGQMEQNGDVYPHR
jgi:hypothetical protein